MLVLSNRRPPRSTRTGPRCPYTTLFRSVVAVTGVDGRNRALIEAGRALHLDYSAPGADMVAANINGEASRVRGTSFAAPFVAGRLYRHLQQASITAAMQALAAEARDLGKRGPDGTYGRGLVCGRSEEHTSELQSLMRTSYADCCLKKKR